MASQRYYRNRRIPNFIKIDPEDFCSEGVDILEEQFNTVSSLQEMATFEIALYYWCTRGIEGMVSQFCPISSDVIDSLPKIDDIIKIVQGSFRFEYPRLPGFMKNNIIHAIKSIGNEVYAWKRLPLLRNRTNIGHIGPKNFAWSSSRTHDRPRTICVSKKFDLSKKEMCPCCMENYVKSLWQHTDPIMQRFYTKFFGCYKYHGLVFEKLYLEHFLELNVIQQYFSPEDTPLENIFFMSVYFAYYEAVVSYWSQMSRLQREKNIDKAIDIFFDSCYTNVINERKTTTFSFLWNKLQGEKRRETLDSKFYHVLRLLLPWPMTEYLVPVLNFNRIVDYEDPIYYLLLHETAKKIPRDFHETDVYRRLFIFLSRHALRSLTVYRIQHLILSVLEYPEDLDLAAFIMRKCRRKRQVARDLFAYPCTIKPPLIRAFLNIVGMWSWFRLRRVNYTNGLM